MAVVQKVIREGKHGPFVVATSDQLDGSVTFSLEPTVWEEKDWPEEGMIVLLEKLRLKNAGWRAKKGRFLKPSDEQTEIRKEQDMLKKAKVIIEGFRNKWFPAGDDKVWKQWVEYKRRDTRDLTELLKSDVRDDFKRRAIFLLLVPAAEFNPIYWTEKVGKFYHSLDFLNILTPDLLNYATDLIVEFDVMIKPMHNDKPENHVQGGCGVTVFMSVPDKYHNALYFYNNCIMLLLTLLSEEQCKRVFPLLSLRDISTYWNMDNASGYNPFQKLLCSNVDEQWKRQADATMRQIIKDELSNKIKPRKKWEDALKCYAEIIQLQLYGEKLPYNIELFSDQIKFLISEGHDGRELINEWHIPKIFQILSTDDYKEIRYLVAKFVVFNNKSVFKVWSEDTLQGAKMMLDEFGQNDQKLAQRIQAAIDDYKKQSAKNQNEQTNAKKDEDDIINKMK